MESSIMSIEEINEERQTLADKRLEAVKHILNSGIIKAEQIKDILENQYGITVTVRTVRTDLKLIKKSKEGMRKKTYAIPSTFPSPLSESKWTHCPGCGAGLLKDRDAWCGRCGWFWDSEKKKWIAPDKPVYSDTDKYFLGLN